MAAELPQNSGVTFQLFKRYVLFDCIDQKNNYNNKWTCLTCITGESLASSCLVGD